TLAFPEPGWGGQKSSKCTTTVGQRAVGAGDTASHGVFRIHRLPWLHPGTFSLDTTPAIESRIYWTRVSPVALVASPLPHSLTDPGRRLAVAVPSRST